MSARLNSRFNSSQLASSARTRAILGAAVVLSAASSVSAADITSSWLAAGSGTWSNAANWTAGVPNNGTQTYAAVIGASGTAYTVTLGGLLVLDVVIDQLGGSAALGILTAAVIVGNAPALSQTLGLAEAARLGESVEPRKIESETEALQP